jgi:nucleoside-diphosphate-sugar epimerase
MRRLSRLNVVVTGGAGFIGSHLCDRLIQSGHRVICIDNLFTGSFSNIRPLINHPAFEFIEHDIREPLDLPGPILLPRAIINSNRSVQCVPACSAQAMC